MGAADTVKVVETTAGGEVIGEAGEVGVKVEEEAAAVVPEGNWRGRCEDSTYVCRHCLWPAGAYGLGL